MVTVRKVMEMLSVTQLLIILLTMISHAAMDSAAFVQPPSVSDAASVSPLRICDAAGNQDWQQVGELLNAEVDVSVAQADGMTALHWAVYYDETETARLLVAAGADVNAKNRYGVFPLSLACLNGNAGIVELLLKSGADVQATLRGGESPLMTASRTGRPEPVRLLIQHGASVDAREARGQSALMWAAADGHLEVVRLLVASGADFRTPLKSGFTPLLFAVREGQSDVVRFFLEAGADVNEVIESQPSSGKAPRRGTSPLILAIENGHFELAVQLLDAGADPNDQRSGYTPLHTMTWVRKPNRGDGDDGAPPPVGSGDMTSLKFVRKLVAAGADANARLKKGVSGRGRLNQTGATPFLMAADTADVPLMKLLLELGADPRLPNVDNSTPLMAAAGLGTMAPGEEAGTEDEVLAALQLTIELGGDVNAVDNNGETAMHGAAYAIMPRVVQLLADNGAEIKVWNRKNKYGWTPILIAEGYRPGNFRPSLATVEALHRVMLAAGVTPPAPTPRPVGSELPGYQP